MTKVRIKKRKTHEVYRRFFTNVLPALAVPILVMAGIYYWSIYTVKQQTYEKNVVILQNCSEVLRKTFDNMDNLITYISESSSISRVFLSVNPNPLYDGSTTVDILEIQKELKTLTTANDLIRNIQIYSIKKNILIDSNTTALYIDRYYSHDFSIKNMSFDEWYNTLLLPMKNYDIISNLDISYIGSDTKTGILYAKSLPITQKNNIVGNIFICLDEEYLFKLFSSIPYENAGFIYILGDDGRPILYDSSKSMEKAMADSMRFTKQNGYFSQNINGHDMFITYYKDNNRNWIYVAAIPKDQVLKTTTDMQIYIGIMIVITLISSVILLNLSVTKLSKPISNIYSLLVKKNADISYDDFESEISRLVNENQEMLGTLTSQIPIIKNTIFYNLLTNGYQDQNEIKDNFVKIGIELDAQFYVLMILSINDLDTSCNIEEISACNTYINCIISQYFHNLKGIYNLDIEKTVFLLSYKNTNYDQVMKHVEKTTEQIIEHIYAKVKMSISFAGDITDKIVGIPSCFFNANIAINFRKKDSSYTVLWFNLTSKIRNKESNYTVILESQLHTLVDIGNTELLSELFSNIESKYKHEHENAEDPELFNLMQSMNCILIDFLKEPSHQSKKLIGVEAKILSQMNKSGDMFRTFYLLKEAFLFIAVNKHDDLKQNNFSLQNQIHKYIDDHFTDSQLSLSSVADVFNITEIYLSGLFKQETGENFSKYVEKLRMKKALSLLETGKFLINEVSEMVGYNSPQVFRRAYKRQFNGNPNEAKH